MSIRIMRKHYYMAVIIGLSCLFSSCRDYKMSTDYAYVDVTDDGVFNPDGSRVIYGFSEDGKVFRNGVEIGTYQQDGRDFEVYNLSGESTLKGTIPKKGRTLYIWSNGKKRTLSLSKGTPVDYSIQASQPELPINLSDGETNGPRKSMNEKEK